MIALNTNLLVYAHRRDSPWHAEARRHIATLAEGQAVWAIFIPPSTLGEAIGQVEAWLESPTLVLLAEGSTHWSALRAALETARAVGPLVHDARIAALCRQHGVRELWTADRDFGRSPDLPVRNPLVG